MASTASPTTATAVEDGDHLNTDKASTGVAENSEGRTTTTTTMANQQQKNDKRSRRVSFAEMTSVHFFDRDEFNETHSDTSPKSSGNEGGEGLGFAKLVDSRDDEQVEGDNDRDEGSEDDDDDVRRSFFRPMESPSSGSILGSATSNDEDNFFGPVSASFIRPGRLSDSAASDENHDITMDSTAFSMHFRSLARSDSGLDLKTPTGVHLSFDEKTPTHTTIGSSMDLTKARKSICVSAVPVTDGSGSSDSSDMSLVGETSRRYDYERLSTELDELFAEGKKDLDVVSGSDNISASDSPMIVESKSLQSMEQGNGPLDSKSFQSTDLGKDPVELSIDQKLESGTYILNDILADESPHKKLDSANGGPKGSPICLANNLFASSTLDTPASKSLDNPTQPPNQDRSVTNSKNSVEEPSSLYMPDEFVERNHGALQTLDNGLGQLDGNMQHGSEFPLQELRSYSPSKQKKAFMGTLTPSRYSLMVTPPLKQNTVHYGSASSIQKSISKLEKFQASAISSYLNAKVNNSYIQSLESLKGLHSNSLLERNNDNLQNKLVRDLVYNEKQLHSAQKGEVRSINDTENGIAAAKHSQDVDHTVEYLDHVETAASQAVQLMKLTPSAASSSQKRFPGKRRDNNHLASEDHIDKSIAFNGIGSSSAEIIPGSIGKKKEINTLPRFVSSSDKRLRKLPSPENQGSLFKDLVPNDVYLKSLAFSRSQGSASKGRVVDTQLVNATVGNAGAGLLGRTEQVSLPVTELNGKGGVHEVDRAFVKEDNPHYHQDALGSSGKFGSLLRDEERQIHSMSLDVNPKSAMSLLSRSNLSGGESGGVFSFAPSARRNLIDSGLQKNLLECFDQSPSREELPESKDSVSCCPPKLEDLASPRSLQLMENSRNSSGRKRKSEDVAVREKESIDDDTLIQRSPKLQKISGHDAETLGCPAEVRGEVAMGGHELEEWSDIYSKILEDAERLLSPSADQLNLHAVDVMDDILSQQQRSKTYRVLYDGSLPQRTSVPCDFGYGRTAETRLLLHRLMYEKAKSQLMRLKRGKLQEKVQQLSSGLQECQILKSSPLLQKSIECPPVAPADSVCVQARHNDGKQVSCDKVTAMVQYLEASKSQISNLIKTLHSCCNIKGEHSCADTVVLVDDHLTKRRCCRFIHMDMQMWVVHNMDSRNGHPALVLNYFGFIIQRLAVTVGAVSSIVITNKLDDANISKKFRNMDACTAFEFVLNTESTRRYVGVRSLAQETQVTSSILSNLLDVIEEVQLAQLELRNLTSTRFHSESAEQLALQLCFFNFKSGRKVTLKLDVSCLKRGIYPSETSPSVLTAADCMKKDSFPEQVFTEIGGAVKNLRAGYMRIVRLCRCISHVVQASSV